MSLAWEAPPAVAEPAPLLPPMGMQAEKVIKIASPHARQGKKAPNRLATMAGICMALEGALELLGLHTADTGALLAELCALALVRCHTARMSSS